MKYKMFFGCLLLVIQADANELYRWQDASGQWHFGDAANVDRRAQAEEVAIAPEASNVVKTKIVKLPVRKTEKSAAKQRSGNKDKQAAVLSASEKKQKCEKLREELRLQAFRYADRDYYDHECVSAVKW